MPDSNALIRALFCNDTPVSSPAKAGDPVNTGLSSQPAAGSFTGCSAFAGMTGQCLAPPVWFSSPRSNRRGPREMKSAVYWKKSPIESGRSGSASPQHQRSSRRIYHCRWPAGHACACTPPTPNGAVRRLWCRPFPFATIKVAARRGDGRALLQRCVAVAVLLDEAAWAAGTCTGN